MTTRMLRWMAAAAVLALAVGDLKDSIVILVVVLLNAALGFYQEHRAEAAVAATRMRASPTLTPCSSASSGLISSSTISGMSHSSCETFTSVSAMMSMSAAGISHSPSSRR